jgi:CHAD domain-containing protein
MKLSKQNAPVYPRQTVQKAFVALLEQHLFHLSRWEETARTREDIEGVHQLRVGLRRMRSALRVFRPALPREISRPWSEEMRYLAAQLGPARDLDVFISEGLGEVGGRLPLPGGEALRAIAEQRRDAAYETVRAMLDSDRYADFKRGFADWLAAAAWQRGPLSEQHHARLNSNVIRFARRRLKKQRDRVLSRGKETDWAVAEDLHRLRIECKKLRYAAEFFNPLFDGMNAFIAHLKDLQDGLGVLNDVAVTRSLLDELLVDAADPDARRYADGLLGWRCHEAHRLQTGLRDLWRDFRETPKPW